jgi:hypothetical protein
MVAARAIQAHRIAVPFGVRRTRSPPLAVEARGQITGGGAVEPGRDGPGPGMGPAGQGLALAGWLRHTRAVFRPCGMVAPTPHRRFGERPRAGGLAARGASGAGAVPGGCRGPLPQATVRDDSLPPRAAVAVRDVLEQDQIAARAATGQRPAPGACGGVGCGGRGEDRPRQVTAPSVVGAKQRQVDRAARVPRGSGGACRHASPLRVGGERLAPRREGILPRGMWAVGAPRRARAPARPAAPPQRPGRPPGGGRAGGRRAQAAPAQDRDRVGSALVVLRWAPVAGLHGEGRPQDNGKPCLSAAVGAPGPRCTGLRPRRQRRPERGPCAGEASPGGCACGAAAGSRRPGCGGRQPWAGRASRGPRNIAVAWWRSAGGLRRVSVWPLTRHQQTTAGCRGGGLNQYQHAAADRGRMFAFWDV